MTIAQGSGQTTATEQAFLLFVSGDSRSPDTGCVFLLPCILVANFRRDLTLLGTRILRKQGLVLIDPPSRNRPHVVRVEDNSSALYQDYSSYPAGTPIIKCPRSNGGLIGLPAHKQGVFTRLLSIMHGTPFDAAEALNFYIDFADMQRLSRDERGIYAAGINDALGCNSPAEPSKHLKAVPEGSREASAHFSKRGKIFIRRVPRVARKTAPSSEHLIYDVTDPGKTTPSSSLLRWSLLRTNFQKLSWWNFEVVLIVEIDESQSLFESYFPQATIVSDIRAIPEVVNSG